MILKRPCVRRGETMQGLTGTAKCRTACLGGVRGASKRSPYSIYKINNSTSCRKGNKMTVRVLTGVTSHRLKRVLSSCFLFCKKSNCLSYKSSRGSVCSPLSHHLSMPFGTWRFQLTPAWFHRVSRRAFSRSYQPSFHKF